MGNRYNPAASEKEATQQSVNNLGAVHLSYRGQKYVLKDGVVNVNLVGKPGVPDDWEPPTQYADGMINLNLIDEKFAPIDEYDVDEHIPVVTE